MNPADLLTCHILAQEKARYCRSMDTKDWSALAELFTDDVVFDLSDGNPHVAPIVGRAETIAAVRESVGDAVTVHQVHAPEFELDGDEARAIWAVQERVVWDNGTSLTAYGHYHDRWVRHGDRWRIAELRLTHLMMESAGPA
ncbi:nuclear transport factor 2 family protein [Mycolicibacterium sp. 050232]|uniref:nuclear transport factor 2 family protein n=1 Tax=Mycolicibacterium sp. 050232 TaxID=3113982 RepID=UPI002E27DA48|nr:nuclear transport factor 2 family protein [Mycolicibacterium sp. 050232]MED5810895.1 nuclear transport factor 2 family protein [Mycolicibacterium sp. 050232]